MRDGPTLVVAAATGSLFGSNTARPTPLPHRELGPTNEASKLVDGVELANGLSGNEPIQRLLDLRQPLIRSADLLRLDRLDQTGHPFDPGGDSLDGVRGEQVRML